ncbi:hypothetical protein ACI6Q2_14460 [Chitinophagaceae bacterium LWZ2-11]
MNTFKIKHTLFISSFLVLCFACKTKTTKDGKPVDTPSTNKAGEIIAYTNSVVDLCNGYRSYVESSDKYMANCEKALKTTKKDNFTFMGNIKSFSIPSMARGADPTKPTSQLTSSDQDFFKLNVSNIQKYYKNLTDYNDKIDKYIKAEDYKDDKGAKGLAIIDSAYAAIDTITSLRIMLYNRVDIVAEESEKVLLEKDPLKDNVLAMKEDMVLAKKLIKTLAQDKNITVVISEADSIYTKMESNAAAHKGINPELLKKESKASSYDRFYQSFDDLLISARKTIRDVKESKNVTSNQIESLRYKSESLTSSYNSYTK